MPSLQNVILTDRATPTPVAHTFVPRGHEGTDGGRVVKAGVSAVADLLFTIEPRNTAGGRRKVDLRLVLPVVQNKVEDGVSSYVVSRANRATVTFDFAGDSTEQERKDLVGMIYSSLDASKTLVNDTLVKNESVW
jgi:hypothetical protein